MEINLTSISDCIKIKPYIHYDYRGEYIETWNLTAFSTILSDKFKQDDISTSKKNVLRGLHGDWETYKLVQCLQGEIMLVVVDCRNDHGKHETFILNDKNRHQILIPPGCANGHLVLSDSCIFSYKQTTLYQGADKQFTLKWNDSFLNINWPTESPILSLRDQNGQTFEQITQQ